MFGQLTPPPNPRSRSSPDGYLAKLMFLPVVALCIMSGLEAVGVILGILPLVVNQLDNYVQGFQKVRLFRTRNYRRRMEEYNSGIAQQQLILLGTLDQVLYDIVDDKDDISELLSDQQSALWRDEKLRNRLQQKLGRNHGEFTKLIVEIANLTADLSSKLGHGSENVNTSASNISAFKRQINKIGDIISDSIYQDLLRKIEKSNSILEKLVDKAPYQAPQQKSRRLKSLTGALKSARLSAASLYTAVMQASCWNCRCNDAHRIQFQFDTESPLGNASNTPGPYFKFKMRLLLDIGKVHTEDSCSWQELEVQSVAFSPSTQESTGAGNNSKAVQNKSKGKQIRLCQSEPDMHPSSSTASTEPPPGVPLTNLCPTFISQPNTTVIEPGKRVLGFILEGQYHHGFYFCTENMGSLKPTSLEETIQAAARGIERRKLFSRRDRLVLATILGYSVLQLHGNWLKADWRARDILLLQDQTSYFPYLMLEVPSAVTSSSQAMEIDSQKKTGKGTPLNRNELLYPLGLALLELSLGLTLSELRAQAEDDAKETWSELDTASHYLNMVNNESGPRYGDVVDKCLFSSQRQGDDDLVEVVAPLFEDLRAFDARS